MKNKKKPLVSVVIPCFNHENFVQQTIQSVIDQDYKNIELIIIDDGSKDSSVEKIKSLVSVCINRFEKFYFIHRNNKGLCKTLNEAIDICSGEYFCCLASDDIILKDKISYQVKYLESNSESIGVFGGVEVIGCVKNRILKKKGINKYYFNDIYLHQHMLMAPTQMLRLNQVKNVGGFKEGFLIEDWYMWLALTKNGGSLDCIGKVFAKYRRHDNNISSKFELMHSERLKILEFYRGELYKKALAIEYLIYAEECASNSIFKSLRYIINSFKINKKIIFSKSFYRSIILSFIKSL
ncbi:glycosyltransferase family 2 protein [Comamonas jiangduensis]|uniref:glycosyltransferase family 2 protein n=1 Tax=Comamonas jiangduensis TaxID=1194168 RepID=UPI0028A5F2A8|nr:glycosyltransferase [Comamonas jiangduensis]